MTVESLSSPNVPRAPTAISCLPKYIYEPETNSCIYDLSSIQTKTFNVTATGSNTCAPSPLFTTSSEDVNKCQLMKFPDVTKPFTSYIPSKQGGGCISPFFEKSKDEKSCIPTNYAPVYLASGCPANSTFNPFTGKCDQGIRPLCSNKDATLSADGLTCKPPETTSLICKPSVPGALPKTLEDGVCYDISNADSVSYSGSYKCKNGLLKPGTNKCYSNQSAPTCPLSYTKSADNICINPTSVDASYCPPGTYNAGGVCLKPFSETSTCSNGMVLYPRDNGNFTCAKTVDVKKSCEKPWKINGDRCCYYDNCKNIDISCPKNYKVSSNDRNKCISQNQSEWSDPLCPEDYKFNASDGTCSSLLNPTCNKPGYLYSIEKRQCVNSLTGDAYFSTPLCDDGYSYNAENKNCEYICPSGKTLDSNYECVATS